MSRFPLDPSNINILEEPETPPGQLCPTNWDYFGGSCYLLRNQVIIFEIVFGENNILFVGNMRLLC